MKYNEFRLGNILQEPRSGALLRVCSLSDKTLLTELHNGVEAPIPADWDAVPVKINNRVLVAAGFEIGKEYGPNVATRKDVGFQLYLRPSNRPGGVWEWCCTNREGYMNEAQVDVLYLHQLQNLWYVINGTELQMDLKSLTR